MSYTNSIIVVQIDTYAITQYVLVNALLLCELIMVCYLTIRNVVSITITCLFTIHKNHIASLNSLWFPLLDYSQISMVSQFAECTWEVRYFSSDIVLSCDKSIWCSQVSSAKFTWEVRYFSTDIVLSCDKR